MIKQLQAQYLRMSPDVLRYCLKVILILFVLIPLPLCSQQLPLFSVYRNQGQVLNPAAISDNYLINEMNLSASATFRRQWLGLKEAPTTQIASFEYILPNSSNIITGGHIVNDKTGKLGQSGVYGRFAYTINIGHRSKQALTVGLGAGLVQYRVQLAEIEFAETEDFNLLSGKTLFPDFSLGAFYYHKDKLYAGISVPQIFGLKTVFRDTTNQRAFDIQRVAHVYGLVGAYIDVAWFGSSTSFIEPSMWLRYVPNSPISADVNIRYHIGDFYWLGLGGGFGFGDQFSSGLHFETGFKLGETINIYNGQWKIGFAYDVSLSQYQNLFGNTFEVNVSYAWFN